MDWRTRFEQDYGLSYYSSRVLEAVEAGRVFPQDFIEHPDLPGGMFAPNVLKALAGAGLVSKKTGTWTLTWQGREQLEKRRGKE